MTFALIEVEATAKKATRGAGYGWGMAEEAAKATRWLCAAGLDGIGGLATALGQADGWDKLSLAPGQVKGDWQAESGDMCPLMAGAALSDSVHDWAETGKRISDVVAPIMLLPFAALAARQLDNIVTVQWSGVTAVTDGRGVTLSLDSESSLFNTAGEVSIQTGGQLDPSGPLLTRADPTDKDWAALNSFAHRTYAPDTEESRIKGAGAGLTDND